MKLIGFHGTDANNEASILSGNFRVSAKSDEWLGTGAYFFIEGLGDPEHSAVCWAKLQSYDKVKKRYRYTQFSVIKAKISISNPLDLDSLQGKKVFNYFRDEMIGIMKQNNISATESFRNSLKNDCEICNYIAKTIGCDAIIRSEYIKLDLWSRKNVYNSRIQNCTIVSIREPSQSIDKNSLTVTQRGRVI
ncbi:hypothetical protein [Xenorhabdus anantnagensis]|uniref:Uncharacterized protein n=1 Tax=Xenorhabdus anantnagensis TaxID=3025875 RepID=A0ABT5LX31_9GAMM|nr:hypothetical protein [Xenorhabdus anantnagensis]MDC9599002.1 hypothetical protein [Xenorhabdus anantnagensis]